MIGAAVVVSYNIDKCTGNRRKQIYEKIPVSVPVEGWLLVGVLYALNGICKDNTWSAGREKSEGHFVHCFECILSRRHSE